jgi:hypothetical protein
MAFPVKAHLPFKGPDLFCLLSDPHSQMSRDWHDFEIIEREHAPKSSWTQANVRFGSKAECAGYKPMSAKCQ